MEYQAPFRILSVGSGDGEVDLLFLENLSKLLCHRKDQKGQKVQIFARAIEPEKSRMEGFTVLERCLARSESRHSKRTEKQHAGSTIRFLTSQAKPETQFPCIYSLVKLYFKA